LDNATDLSRGTPAWEASYDAGLHNALGPRAQLLGEMFCWEGEEWRKGSMWSLTVRHYLRPGAGSGSGGSNCGVTYAALLKLKSTLTSCIATLLLVAMINAMATKANNFLNTLTPPSIHANYKGGL